MVSAYNAGLAAQKETQLIKEELLDIHEDGHIYPSSTVDFILNFGAVGLIYPDDPDSVFPTGTKLVDGRKVFIEFGKGTKYEPGMKALIQYAAVLREFS